MSLKSRLSQFILLAGSLLAACITDNASAAVVASIRPLAFIASAITEGVITTQVLLPDGASPHNYALRPSDIQRLYDADLVIWVGPEMEGFLVRPLVRVPAHKQIVLSELPAIRPLLIKNEKSHSHAINASEDHENGDHTAYHGKNHEKKAEEEHFHGEWDMHIWLSVSIAKQIAGAIHQKLSELLPENREKLDANLRQFNNNLVNTEKNIASMLKSVQRKGYFVFHDAWGYFEKHFGLSSLGYFTVNPEIQPSAQRLYQLRTKLIKEKAVCVFAEPQFRPAVIDTVIRGTGVRSGVLDPLGIDIMLNKDSYMNFLSQLSNQYLSCLASDL